MSGKGNLGRWNKWYIGLGAAEPYGDTRSYEVGAAFLSDCRSIEDWGCGKGWLRRYVSADRYRGIDGSDTPFADTIADLCGYRSRVDGVFLRHVLEHNYEWRAILSNALASAARRCVIVLFTPLCGAQRELNYCEEIGVPDLALPRREFEAALSGHDWSELITASDTFYGQESIFLVSAAGVEHVNAVQRACGFLG
jgi:hypothetical protein